MNISTKVDLAELWMRQQGRCHYCGGSTALLGLRSKKRWAQMLGVVEGPNSKQFNWHVATREHITRQAVGGYDGADNIVMACCFCNSTRQTMSVDLHREAMLVMVQTGQHPVGRGRPVGGLP